MRAIAFEVAAINVMHIEFVLLLKYIWPIEQNAVLLSTRTKYEYAIGVFVCNAMMIVHSLRS